jgi:methylenetetrahydrofolate dehydrogenase (NADP+)/methenyltetrahydrofolate cyclohydrolase
MSVLLDGKAVSVKINAQTLSKAEQFKNVYSESPTIAIIMIGEDDSCKKYTRMKRDAAEKLGIVALNIDFNTDVQESKIIKSLEHLNYNDGVHGIMIQHPVGGWMRNLERRFFDTISPMKDVDGLTSTNFSKLALNSNPVAFQPATAKGIIHLLDSYGFDLKGNKVTVIGSSPILGLPLSMLMHHRGATVSVCNINTPISQLETLCYNSDIIVGACGVHNLVQPFMINEGIILIDVGCAPNTYGVFRPDCYEKSSYHTKPIGCVGPMTISILMSQVVQAAKESKRYEVYQG